MMDLEASRDQDGKEDTFRGCVTVGHQRVETVVVLSQEILFIRPFSVVLTQNIVNIFLPVLNRLFGNYSRHDR